MAESRIPGLIRRRPINLSLPPPSFGEQLADLEEADLGVYFNAELNAIVLRAEAQAIEIILAPSTAWNLTLRLVAALLRSQEDVP